MFFLKEPAGITVEKLPSTKADRLGIWGDASSANSQRECTGQFEAECERVLISPLAVSVIKARPVWVVASAASLIKNGKVAEWQVYCDNSRFGSR